MKPDGPVITIVSSLLLHMLETEQQILEITAEDGYSFTRRNQGKVTVPFSQAMNRLKVMCRLIPQKYSEPVQGKIVVACKGQDHEFNCFFDDSCPSFRIEMKQLRSQQD